jgi:SAM-dependent methyltransferase
MNKSLLVKLIGFPATLIHGDPLVLDRWLWLEKRLPLTRNGETLIDIGCGTGAFTIGAALRGYKALGVSWDERNQSVASQRANLCKAVLASFEVLDVRSLDTQIEWKESFDVAICCENIEHILNDQKLMQDISSCLKPGGRLLLTAPYYLYRAITPEDNGPFCKEETGWHVRRGYTQAMLVELCDHAGLKAESVSFTSGFLSQKVEFIRRLLSRINPLFGWLVILPMRPFLPLLDPVFTQMLRWPHYSICLEAYKPRFMTKST